MAVKRKSEQIDDEQIATVAKKKTCGSKSASVMVNNTATNEDIARIIGESFQFFKLPIVKTDDECAERLNWYFNLCVEKSQIPTVEDMSLALGTVRRTVWDWENGTQGPVRAHMIRKAKELLAGIDAKLVSEGKIPQVTYIFRAKNFFGMKDQQEVVLEPRNPLGETPSDQEIASHITGRLTD